MADEESMESQEIGDAAPMEDQSYEQKEPENEEYQDNFNAPPQGPNDYPMQRFNGPGPRSPYGGPPRFGPRGMRSTKFHSF